MKRLARHAGVSKWTLRRYARRLVDPLPHRHTPGKIVARFQEYDEWLARQHDPHPDQEERERVIAMLDTLA